jgi:uncharacterized protein
MTLHALLGLAWSLSMFIGAGAATLQSAASAAGHWEGTIETPGQTLDIIVELDDRADGTWGGTITIPAQNVKGFALSPLSVEGDAVTFGMKGIPGDPLFKGTLSRESKTMSGTFSQGGVTLPFTLSWKGEPKVEAPPKSTAITKDVEGTWEGALNVQGAMLRLTLDLANEAGSGVGTLTSLDQGGIKIPVAQISQNDATITLLVSAIGASYQGSLANGAINGTWTQSGQKYPLVFKRASK